MSIQLKKQLFPDAETHETLSASWSDVRRGASSPTGVHTVSHRADALTYLRIRVSRDTYNRPARYMSNNMHTMYHGAWAPCGSATTTCILVKGDCDGKSEKIRIF